jgi:tRNA dimethylallyltransferase
MWLATQFPLAVVSADSRQVFRQFDLGTAKPTAEERAAVPHFGIDVLAPTERATAAWWAGCVDQWSREIESLGRLPVVVGGTGLYLRALFGTLFTEPEIDQEYRRRVQGELEFLPLAELRRWTETLDPARAHLGRTQLLRAIEMPIVTGQRLSVLQRVHERPPLCSARYLVVDPGPRLADDIAARTRSMLEQGWADEVRALMEIVPADAPPWNATGYSAIRDMLEGRLTPTQAEERIVIATRQYAKRQRTWFRNQLAGEDVTRLDPFAPDWSTRVLAWWHGAAA